MPGFTGSTTFHVDVPCTYDLEVTAAKYFYGLTGGEAPLIFHFTGMVLYAGEHDRLQVRPVPWSCSVRWRMPVDTLKAAIAACYPGGGWIRLSPETLRALNRRARGGGPPHVRRARGGDAAMTQLEELVRTLLYEGYALYPYTPGATKNATPTPFGIVYPPVYAAGSPTTFERIRLQGVVEGGETLAASVRFLEGSAERRVDLPATPLGPRRRRPRSRSSASAAACGWRPRRSSTASRA